MTTALIIAACAIGALYTTRIAFRHAIHSLRSDGHHTDWSDVAAAGLFALTAASFFPIVLVGLLCKALVEGRDAEAFARRVAGESKSQRNARQARELREQARRIADLEHELRIR